MQDGKVTCETSVGSCKSYSEAFCFSADRASIYQFRVSKESECCQVGGQSFLVTLDKLSLLLQFKTPSGLLQASDLFLRAYKCSSENSFFGFPDLKNFQLLLRRESDEETREGHEDAGRRSDAQTQSFQVVLPL